MKISTPTAAQLAATAKRFGLRLILLFGSAVRGSLHARSDLDLALLLRDPDPGIDKRVRLEQDLQQAFPGEKIDVAVINHADPLFLKKILEDCQLLYGDLGDFQRLKIYAFRRYQDHKRFLEMENAYARRFIREINAKP